MSSPPPASATAEPTAGTGSQTPEKPLRRDAARNRDRILEAAGELFAQAGLGTTLNDVAHYAGVGVGTVYRHFPDREELIMTLLEARVERLVEIGEAGLADPDPWNGLILAMEGGLELQAADRGLRELVHASPAGLERVIVIRERLFPIIEELLARAQAAGAVRAEVVASDIAVLQMMTVAVIDSSREVKPEIWRRYLWVVLRGIATTPEAMGPLPVAPLGVDEVDLVMTASPPLHHRHGTN